MRSIVAVTNEMDDAKKAAGELLKQINEKGSLSKNSLGLVYCDVAIEHDAFVAELQKELPFDIIGNTTIATFDTDNGAQIMSVVLTVLTADDVTFSTVVTNALNSENIRAELEVAYKAASAQLSEPEKLIFIVPPFVTDAVPLDEYVDTLSELSGDVPMFGGLPSSSMADGDIIIHARGHTYSDRAAIVLLSGNINPIFTVQNILSTYSDQKFVVTKSKNNIIYTVNDMTFVDYLRSAGMDIDELMAQGDLAVYVSTPIKVNLSKHDYNDGIPVVRIIKTINPEDNSGVLFGAVPEGSTISIGAMKRKDIQESCNIAVKAIQEKIAAKDTEYNTLLCISCGGRYMVMADDKDLEGDVICASLPKELTFSGFYSFGEICPTEIVDGKAVNRVHNASIVMCVL
ncbi:MAG: FIST C-terminal domain-containing protein [Deferribacteraceae bacterium]|nr:FIST C-terminal domain-containing protein [Deferribacteraceae bacterium]